MRTEKESSPQFSGDMVSLHNMVSPQNGDTRQRWSRGPKARGQGQGQGHKKNPRPRPRTAFSRTEPLEAKDRNAGGQGQGPRTQAQVFSEKKVFKNFFQAISNSLAYPEFLIGGGLNHKSHAMTSSKFFQRGSFCLTKIS